MASKTNDFPVALVDFEVHRIRSTNCVWFDPEALAEYSTLHPRWDAGTFSSTFGYGVKNTACFSRLEFDEQQTKIYHAERYGGIAGGKNGGGSRCGNFQGFQIKGCGGNPLVGRDAPAWYSHGSLNLIDAVCEAIYSNVLNQALPLGAARCFGILTTSADGSYYSSDGRLEEINSAWGALLVREACSRPAHFLRSRGFRPLAEHRHAISDDVVRVRQLNRELNRHFGSHQKFAQYIGHFLDNCANQYSFASIARLAHGAATPSNLSIDGRWLDLTNVSFLQGGKNYMMGPGMLPSSSEHLLPEAVAGEMVETYAKYNQVDLNIKPLIDYYRQAMHRHFHRHCAFLYGFSAEAMPPFGQSDENGFLTGQVSRLLTHNGTVRLEAPPEIDWQDPVILFCRALFTGLVKPLSAESLINTLFPHAPEGGRTVAAFKAVFDTAHAGHYSQLDYFAFAKRSAIISLKRAYYSAFFYWCRFRRLLEQYNGDTAPLSAYAELIENSRAAGAWIFGDADEENTLLFLSPRISLHYNAHGDRFVVNLHGALLEFGTGAELARWAADQVPELWQITGYDFLPGLERILDVVTILDAAQAKIFRLDLSA